MPLLNGNAHPREVTMSNSSETLVATENASSYLQRLCKHFGHKTEVTFTPKTGTIAFEFGTADLRAEAEGLVMTARAETDENLERLKRVLAKHLERFAFREELEVDWLD